LFQSLNGFLALEGTLVFGSMSTNTPHKTAQTPTTALSEQEFRELVSRIDKVSPSPLPLNPANEPLVDS
jgi:hypothetical protein